MPPCECDNTDGLVNPRMPVQIAIVALAKARSRRQSLCLCPELSVCPKSGTWGTGHLEQQHFRRYLRHYRASVTVVVVASVLLNLLVFAGTLYMLMVYDSVLPSGSMPTLFALFGLLILVYLFQGRCQSVANRSPFDGALLLRGSVQAASICHSASAAERRSL